MMWKEPRAGARLGCLLLYASICGIVLSMVIAQAYQRAKPAKLPLRDAEGQQSPRLASYQYSAIGPTNIRVLDILPGDVSSETHFRLREKELGNGDIYYALSYAWGPPVFTHKIYSAEGFINVTENLWEALRRYREADEKKTLWVDAVCIDQANIQERSQQILLMRRIYSESKRVLVWLGLESPSTLPAFEFIERIVDLAFKEGRDDLDGLHNEIRPLQTDEYQDAVTNLFAKSWFLRVWTFQEINCAAEATVASGSLEIDFEYIRYFAFIWVHIQELVWLKSFAAEHALRQVATLHITRDYLSQQSPVNSLFELVRRARTRLASDPRDMIYGLVALASDVNPLPFPPTYEITVIRLYEEFAIHVIRQNKNLDIFECCTFQPGLREHPSWVPDWRDSDFSGTINPEKDSFRAAGTSYWDTSTAVVNHSLGVEAICLDQLQNISSLGPFPNSVGLKTWESDFLPLAKWQQNTIRETMEITSLSRLYRSEQERWQAWWRAFIGEMKTDLGRATPDDEQLVRSYRKLIDRLVNDGPNRKDTVRDRDTFGEIYARALRMALHRNFCLSLEGRIGWVPRAAQTGDIISLMRGSPVPIIIRPTQQKNSYLMIGQAYIHGVMDGEAVAGKEDQFQRIQLV